jgi:hypothetical protein
MYPTMAPGMTGGGSRTDLQDMFRLKMAQALAQQAQGGPVYSPGQGVLKLLAGALAGQQMHGITSDMDAKEAQAAQELQGAFRPVPDAGVAGPQAGTGHAPSSMDVARQLMGSPDSGNRAYGQSLMQKALESQMDVDKESNIYARKGAWDLANKPTLEGSIEAAKNPALISRAGAMALAENPALIARARGTADAQNASDLNFKPRIAGATAQATLPWDIAKAGGIADATNASDFRFKPGIAGATAAATMPYDLAKMDHGSQNNVWERWNSPFSYGKGDTLADISGLQQPAPGPQMGPQPSGPGPMPPPAAPQPNIPQLPPNVLPSGGMPPGPGAAQPMPGPGAGAPPLDLPMPAPNPPLLGQSPPPMPGANMPPAPGGPSPMAAPPPAAPAMPNAAGPRILLQGAEANQGPPTVDAERQAAGFADRMVNSRKLLEELAKSNPGFDPVSTRDSAARTAGLNAGVSSEGQRYWQAADNWIGANLRKESGAALGKEEIAKERVNYFPVYGDSPETIQQKATTRLLLEQNMIRNAGRAYGTSAPPPLSGGVDPGLIAEARRRGLSLP